MSCRTSIGYPLDSTGCPLEFCKFAANVLGLPILSRNARKISSGNSSRISIGHPLESTRHPLEQKFGGVYFYLFQYLGIQQDRDIPFPWHLSWCHPGTVHEMFDLLTV